MLIESYGEKLKKLKDDLKLKRKVEIHEIEERKNQHINDLNRNHEMAFDELKEYYNDITADNLNLINDQMMEINEINHKRKENTKQLITYQEKNKKMDLTAKEKNLERNLLAKQAR